MKKLNKKGFTLVELLAVIVVLALLMVVATSSIGGALSNAKKNALKTEAQKMLTAVYQEVKSEIMLDSSKYKNADGTDKTVFVGKTDGTDYEGAFKIVGNKIDEFCIIYKSNGTPKFSIKKTDDISFTDDDGASGFSIGNVEVKDTGLCAITKDASTGLVTAIS